MRTNAANALRLTRGALIHYLVAIFVLQGAIVFVAIPAISSLFTLALKLCDLSNLTDRNFHTVLGHPLAVALFLAIIGIALTAVSLQLSTIVVIANRQQAGLSLKIRDVAKDVAWAMRSVLHFQSPLLVAYVFLIAPLGGFGLLSVLTRGISIPTFVTGEFMKTPVGGTGYVAVIAVAAYLNVRMILTLPALVVARKSPLRAMGMSVVATRRQSWRIAALVGGTVLVAMLTTSAVIELLVWVSGLADQLNSAEALAMASMSIGLGQVVAFVLIGIATVIIANLLVALCREHEGLPMSEGCASNSPELKPRTKFIVTRASALVGILAISFTAAPAMAASVPGIGDTLVIAHRGFVGGGVENTIGALEAAAALHPDLIEADFQETKDGRFIASHDSNLLLVSGQNVNTFDLTFDEATAITVSVGGYSDTIPSMAEYVTRAHELGVKLLIEIKLHGHESPDYLDRFLAELDSLQLTDKNIYHSLDAHTVEMLKARRPELRVGYTIAMTLGDIPDVNCDFLVLEQSSYTPEFLDGARAAGKPLYMWTVDDEVAIRDYLRLGVDGIVTDHPDVAMRDRTLLSHETGLASRVHDALAYLSVF